MGRKKAFDPDDILEKAMNLFWQQGYTATSMAELEKTLGINKFSIYNSFGNKHSLFIQSLDRYHDQRFTLMLMCLTQQVTGLGNIEQFFDTLILVLKSQPTKIGCFLTNTSLELGQKDPEAHQRVLTSYALLEKGFYQCLLIARQNQEICSDICIEDASRSLVTSTQGLLTVGKISDDEQLLQSTVRFVISRLKSYDKMH